MDKTKLKTFLGKCCRGREFKSDEEMYLFINNQWGLVANEMKHIILKEYLLQNTLDTKRISKQEAKEKFGVIVRRDDSYNKYYLLENGNVIDSMGDTRYISEGYMQKISSISDILDGLSNKEKVAILKDMLFTIDFKPF